MATIMSKRGNLDNIVTYEHICDTRADMSSIDTRFINLGSICIVIAGENNGLEVYMANSSKEWVPVSMNGGGEGGGSAVSPTVTVTEISDGHRITITDVNGDHVVDIPNGISPIHVQIGSGILPISCDAEGKMKQTAFIGVPLFIKRGDNRIAATTQFENTSYQNPATLYGNLQVFKASPCTENSDGALVICTQEGVVPWPDGASNTQEIQITFTLTNGSTIYSVLTLVKVCDGANPSTPITIQTASDIKNALNNDVDLTDFVGEQITCSKGTDTLTWDIVDYNAQTSTVTIMLHDTLTVPLVFEPQQALMWCENGLAAGDYTFTNGTTSYYFTLTQAIPTEGQLVASDDGTFKTYASQSATATLETGTVSTTEIAGATDLGTTASGLLNHNNRVRQGSSNYAESALLWWLNTDAPAGTLREPITKFSRAYSYNVPGFLSNLDSDFVACLDNVEWLCSTNNTYECPKELGGYTNGISQTYTVTKKIGLASEMEIFGSYGGTPDGSTVFDLYNNATADDRKKYIGTSSQVWWLRSPHWSYVYSERGVGFAGITNNCDAASSYAVVPVVKISKDTILP